MAASVAILFCTKDEIDVLETDYNYNMAWHKANHHTFQGYIDDTHGHYVLVDSEKRLYRESIYSYLDDNKGKQLKEINFDWIFEHYSISDSYFDTDDHKQKWLNKFKDANQELYLWLEYH